MAEESSSTDRSVPNRADRLDATSSAAGTVSMARTSVIASFRRDRMIIRVERAEDGNPGEDAVLAKEVNSAIKHVLLVSSEVAVLPYGELPRSERKTRRMFDNRSFES